ncbi:host attachment protein [Shewanella vesiculosa]|uniref:host attachment protein n=1 Tax=Shewanella vesiculosa TaxID=518738 RepID=UPI00235A145E|nr:host attachment protein [Shewanella vesiculosa]NCP76436.1 host attachment protein [Shewanella vesiculosa]
MRKIPKIWIAAFNGSELRILNYRGPNEDLEVLNDFTFEEPHKLSQNLTSTKRGRVFHIADKNRSAMERPTDPHKKAKARALNKSIAYLESKINQFDRLIVAAPPEALGELRKEFSQSLASKTTEEVPKDLTHLHIKEMPLHLENALNIHKHTFQPLFVGKKPKNASPKINERRFVEGELAVLSRCLEGERKKSTHKNNRT